MIKIHEPLELLELLLSYFCIKGSVIKIHEPLGVIGIVCPDLNPLLRKLDYKTSLILLMFSFYSLNIINKKSIFLPLSLAGYPWFPLKKNSQFGSSVWPAINKKQICIQICI